jgi:hypothetical protein
MGMPTVSFMGAGGGEEQMGSEGERRPAVELQRCRFRVEVRCQEGKRGDGTGWLSHPKILNFGK